MSRSILPIFAATLNLACVGAVASDYSGTYVFSAPGRTITLTQEQDDAGAVRGNLNDGVTTLGESGQVHLNLFPYDEAGNPIHELARTLVFTRRGATAEATRDTGETVAAAREVYINRVKLDSAFVLAVEARYRKTIQDGRYWYDAACGAWGVEDGPTAGFLAARLDLPGPMPADISGGGTGIFINGREIHVLDQEALQKIFGQTIPGRYWLDAAGNLGPESGPAIANLAVAIQKAGGSVTHGYGDAGGARGILGGGMYSGRAATGKSILWYPGL